MILCCRNQNVVQKIISLHTLSDKNVYWDFLPSSNGMILSKDVRDFQKIAYITNEEDENQSCSSAKKVSILQENQYLNHYPILKDLTNISESKLSNNEMRKSHSTLVEINRWNHWKLLKSMSIDSFQYNSYWNGSIGIDFSDLFSLR